MSVEKITKACPFCGEQILEVAVKCKHCQSALTELPVIGFPLGADIAKSQGNSSQSAAVANELTSHKAAVVSQRFSEENALDRRYWRL
jgi:hypothetical protein